jgi:hypothetical protein
MISAWRKSSREFRGCQPLPPPPPPSVPRRNLYRPLPPLVGRNSRQDSNSTNNAPNNNRCSSLPRRRITATAVAVTVAIAPPTPLLPRICDPPTSTPGLALFKCGQVPGGRHPATSPASIGYASKCPSLWFSTSG